MRLTKIKVRVKTWGKTILYGCKKCLTGGFFVIRELKRLEKQCPHIFQFLEILVFFVSAALIMVSPLLYTVISGLFPVLFLVWVFFSVYSNL